MPHPLSPRSSASMGAADAHISLLDADRGFEHGIPPADTALAARVLVLPRLDVDPGPWRPPARGDDAEHPPLALLVDGLLGRHVGMGERVATQMLGPGDVFDPWTIAPDSLLPRVVRWSAFAAATVAVLDGRFATAAQRWPALSRTAQGRLAAQSDRLAVHVAISQLPRVEQRVLALLWHLAERFGRIAPDGVVLDLRLTHRMIGELIGAQRPTVSLAVTSLIDDGLVRRRDDGSYVLDSASRGAFAPAGVPAPLPSSVQPPAVANDDLRERLVALRDDLGAHRTRTMAAVTRSAALRAARHAVHPDESDGAAA
jgi:CRP/FNR family transcriptional regulator, cyclic AMP receptor protein